MESPAGPADLTRLVRIDVQRRTIEADAWLTGLSPWYRSACAAIIRHWSRMLALPCRTPPRGSPHQRSAPAMHGASSSSATPRHVQKTSPTRASAGWETPVEGSGAPTWVDLFNLSCLGGAH